MSKPANGGRAESDQSVGLVSGVALKISAQPAAARRFCKLVIGSSEVIKPDRDIAGINQSITPGLRLLQPRRRIGQQLLLDQALMRLEPRHMRIAEISKPLRLQGHGHRSAAANVIDALMRQP